MSSDCESRMFSDRISDVPRSFIREILKVAVDPEVISFAGGLPNRELFPVAPLQEATARVFEEQGRDVLQYSTTEGDIGLREFISRRYLEKQGLDIPVENILITNGSQQGLDLLGKVFLNTGDGVVIEEPGYLGAIQAFSLYRCRFLPVPVSDEGMDIAGLCESVEQDPKLMYTVPNFQNPAGISYSDENRRRVAEALSGKRTLLVQDDPYGDLRFAGEPKISFKTLLPEQTVLLGSFSKTVVPAFRLGWIVAPNEIMARLITAKQAADLHTNSFSQRVIHRFLQDNDLDAHIRRITEVYGRQRGAMLDCVKRHFPEQVRCTRPEGGMFLWAELPEDVSSMKLFEMAIKDKVAFVPGHPFYVGREWVNTLRLNFSCVDEETIEVGMKRLGKCMERLIG